MNNLLLRCIKCRQKTNKLIMRLCQKCYNDSLDNIYMWEPFGVSQKPRGR